MLGATKLQNPDNDQLWLPTAHGPNVIRMNTVKADYVSAPSNPLSHIWNERAAGGWPLHDSGRPLVRLRLAGCHVAG